MGRGSMQHTGNTRTSGSFTSERGLGAHRCTRARDRGGPIFARPRAFGGGFPAHGAAPLTLILWNPSTCSASPLSPLASSSMRSRIAIAGPTWHSPARARWVQCTVSCSPELGPSAWWKPSGPWWPCAVGGKEGPVTNLMRTEQLDEIDPKTHNKTALTHAGQRFGGHPDERRLGRACGTRKTTDRRDLAHPSVGLGQAIPTYSRRS